MSFVDVLREGIIRLAGGVVAGAERRERRWQAQAARERLLGHTPSSTQGVTPRPGPRPLTPEEYAERQDHPFGV